MALGEGREALSIITSRAGNVSIMGLGLTLVGLAATALIASGGQIWLAHQSLQDALDNAVATMDARHQTSPAVLASLIRADDPGARAVSVVSIGTNGQGGISATVSQAISLWFWASWMGAEPVRIEAQL